MPFSGSIEFRFFFFLAAHVTVALVAIAQTRKQSSCQRVSAGRVTAVKQMQIHKEGRVKKEKREKKKDRQLVTESDSRPLIAESSDRDGAQYSSLFPAAPAFFFSPPPPLLRQTITSPAHLQSPGCTLPSGPTPEVVMMVGGVRQGAERGPYFRTPGLK